MEALKERLNGYEAENKEFLRDFYNYEIGNDIYVLNEAGKEHNARLNYDAKYVADEEAYESLMQEPQPELPGIEATLAERGARYGAFQERARICQNIKSAFRDSPNWQYMPNDTKQALEVIADKAARMLNGDFDYSDNWHDIIGYAKLVENRIKEDEAAKLPQAGN